MSDTYSAEERAQLLALARAALEDCTVGRNPEVVDLAALPPALTEERACFVTLHTLAGELRGCTGTLVARQALAQEVTRITVQTALHDPRFYPVQAAEVPNLVIEISVLTPPQMLSFASSEEIPALLRPHVDGVILIIDGQRATFLPQVWEKAPDPVEFLDLLCHKMGMPPGAWQRSDVQVYTYQSIIIEEVSH